MIEAMELEISSTQVLNLFYFSLWNLQMVCVSFLKRKTENQISNKSERKLLKQIKTRQKMCSLLYGRGNKGLFNIRSNWPLGP